VFNRALIAGLLLCACSPQAAKPEAPTAAVSPSPTQAAALTLTDPTLAQLEGIAPKARVTSPLSLTGLAPANWYFENSFPVVVTDVYGEKIGEAPASPTDVSWTDPDPVKKFAATVTFTTPLEQEGWIVLKQDMPGQDDKGDDKEPLQVKIPVILVPSK
jgi:hypothetical protein